MMQSAAAAVAVSAPPELASLVAAMAAGQPAALKTLFRSCAERVHGVALRLLRQTEDAEEVVSDVFAQAWREASRFDPARGTVESWLLKIAYTRSLDRLRRRAARPDLSPALHPEALTHAYVESDDAAARLLEIFQANVDLQRALSRLSEIQRRCVGLAFLEELSHQEIAERVDLPLGTVKSHVRRGLQALRTQMESMGYLRA